MNQQNLLDLFLELVRIDAVSLQERPVAEFLRKRLAARGVEVLEDDAAQKLNGTCGNLIIHLPGSPSATEPLLLLAHMDTVHSTAGVQPVLKEEVLWSDGTTILGVDNRAGLTLL
ncbi:MAG TPA: peptidase M20, partial [bacterium]|nr:peptidase M20 [bacterium]